MPSSVRYNRFVNDYTCNGRTYTSSCFYIKSTVNESEIESAAVLSPAPHEEREVVRRACGFIDIACLRNQLETYYYDTWRDVTCWGISIERMPELVVFFEGDSYAWSRVARSFGRGSQQIRHGASNFVDTCDLCMIRQVLSERPLFFGLKVCHNCAAFHGIGFPCTACSTYAETLLSLHGDEARPGRDGICKACYRADLGKCDRCREEYTGRHLVRTPRGRLCRHCMSCVGLLEPVNRHDYVPPKTIYFRASKQREDHEYLNSSSRRARELYLGVELEISTGGSGLNVAQVLSRLREMPLWMYWKHDGSISEGFEMVTMPISWGYLQETAAGHFRTMCKQLMLMDISSYDSRQCGIHVHLSRNAFSRLHLYKFLRLWYGHLNLTRKLSRRPLPELERWANPTTLENWAILARDGRQRSPKYSAVNLLHKNSIELRIFNGTLRFSSFMVALESAKASYEFTCSASISEVTAKNFFIFVKEYSDQYPFLSSFISREKIKPENTRSCPRNGRGRRQASNTAIVDAVNVLRSQVDQMRSNSNGWTVARGEQ
jgi:hypothetical protein